MSAPYRMAFGMVEAVPESTFGSDPGSGYKYVQTLEQLDLSSVHRMSVPVETLRGTVDPTHTHIMCPEGMVDEGSTFQTSHYLQGYLGSLPTAADIAAAVNASTGYPIAWFLKAALGGQAYGGTGAEAAAGSSTIDSVVLEDLDASLIDAGHGFSVPSASGYEMGFAKVAAMDTETLTPRVDLESAPTDQSTVYGAITSYTTDSLSDSYTFRWSGWLGSESNTPLRCTLSGCRVASWELVISPRELPKLTLTWRFAKAVWTSDASAGCDYEDWAYGPTGTISVPAPEVVAGIRAVHYSAHDDAQDVAAVSLTLSGDNDLQAIRDVNADGGISDFRMGNRSITLQVRAPYSGEEPWESQDELGWQIVLGSQPGKLLGISLPRTHQVEAPSGPSDESGYAYVDRTFRALLHSSDTQPAAGQAADNRVLSIALG